MRIALLTFLLLFPSVSLAVTVSHPLPRSSLHWQHMSETGGEVTAMDQKIFVAVMSLPRTTRTRIIFFSGKDRMPFPFLNQIGIAKKLEGIAFPKESKFADTYHRVLAHRPFVPANIKHIQAVPLPNTVLVYLSALLFTLTMLKRDNFKRGIRSYARRYIRLPLRRETLA